jgi:probable rRNA maturation factor
MTDRPPSRPTRRRNGQGDGSLTIFIADEQPSIGSTRPPVDAGRWTRLAEQVLDAEGVGGEAELSVHFVGEEKIAELNARFLDVAGSTDVLAFPIDGALVEPDPHPAELPLLLGDVVICPVVAERNAPGHAGSYDDEIALLLVHGILHLLGHDHAVDDERARMQQRERDLLASFHGPLAADPWVGAP